MFISNQPENDYMTLLCMLLTGVGVSGSSSIITQRKRQLYRSMVKLNYDIINSLKEY